MLHVERASTRLFFRDASFTAIGGFCPKLMISTLRYPTSPILSAELNPKALEKETSGIATDLLELGGMLMTARVVQKVLSDIPLAEGQAV